MVRKPPSSMVHAKARWAVLLLLLPTCSNEGRESEGRQLGLTPRVFKPAPAGEVATWQRATSGSAPEGRFLPALTFDETRGLVVMFGGMTRGPMSSLAQTLQDMWEWSPATGAWTLRTSSGAMPAARGGAAMVFDPVRNKVLLFGGRATTGYNYEDLWEWDPTTGNWTERGGSGTHPPARAQHAVLYQKSTDKILLFGGGRSNMMGDATSVSASFGDTWELDSAAGTWTQLAPTVGPSVRHDFGLVWDSTRNKAVLFGGMQIDIPDATGVPKQDIWEWDPAAQIWTERTTTGTKPNPRFAFAMAYDDTRGKVVVLGGSGTQTTGGSNDMWEWDSTTAAWTQTRTGTEAGMPGVRSYSSMIYDHARTRLEMVAGLVPNVDKTLFLGTLSTNEVWEIDAAALTFTNRTMAYQGPSARSFHAMAYNPVTGKVYVFGGNDQTKKGADFWEWDGAKWTEVTGDVKPPSRTDGAMAYDPARQSLILFGGNSLSGSKVGNDVWEWDSTSRTWSQLPAVNSPSERRGHGMVTDTTRKKILMYGGSDTSASIISEFWEWDGATLTWTNRTPAPNAKTPVGRIYPVMSFDEARGKLMLYDGSRSPSVEGESTSAYWEWDGFGGGWTLHDPGENLPSAANSYAVYDPIRRRHVVYTDATVGGITQTWELDANTETWITRQPDVTPGPRLRSAMVFDSGRRVAVVFGGNLTKSPGGIVNDTWEYRVSNLANGEGCSVATATTCASGQCVDSVCCESAGCTGACMACNVRGSEGKCVLAQAGTEVEGSCSSGQACDGAGACKSRNGQACTTADACASGSCVDGVCCDGACTGECKACNLPGHTGICTPQPAGSDPNGECGKGTGACQSMCDGAGACAFPLGLTCGTCLVCDGAGTCTRTDPTCGGTGGTGGEDTGGTKSIPGTGGVGGSVKSRSGGTGGNGGTTSRGGTTIASGGRGGVNLTISTRFGGRGGGIMNSSGGTGGAVTSVPTSKGGTGGFSSGGIISSGGGIGGVATSVPTSQGGIGGFNSTIAGSLPRDAGAGSGDAGRDHDGGLAKGDASISDGGTGRLANRGCGCDLGQAETSRDALLWILAGASLLAWRSRCRRK